MTRKEAERLTRQTDTLRALGFTRDEAEALRRISLTLHRWAEHECNGTIQRDAHTVYMDTRGTSYRSLSDLQAALPGTPPIGIRGDRYTIETLDADRREVGRVIELEGRPYWYNPDTGRRLGYAPDRERGALARLARILNARNKRRRVETAIGDVLGPVEDITSYVQGDPRGCVLYILRPGDVPEGEDVGSYYSRGIGVY